MKLKIGLIGTLVLALAVVSYAQKKPDFSGTWTMDTEKSDPMPQGGGGRQGGGMGAVPMTIKQTADSLTIERSFNGNTNSQVYKLDGTESEITMGRGTAKAKAKWDGDKIVIETTRQGQDGNAVTTTSTYSLNADGTLQVQSSGMGGNTRKTVYKKG